MLLTLVSFGGVLLVLQPEFIFGMGKMREIEDYYFYVGLMVFAALSHAFNLHFIHGLSGRVNVFVNMHYSHMGFMVASGLLCNWVPYRVKYEDVGVGMMGLLLGVVVTGFVAQLLVFSANVLQKPSKMMPFGYICVIVGFLADVYIFDTEF